MRNFLKLMNRFCINDQEHQNRSGDSSPLCPPEGSVMLVLKEVKLKELTAFQSGD